jgi:DNA-binding transcriptional regulator LsrR (DeoR family)
MYYREGLSQPTIASRLSLSQSSISRLLKQAEELGIVHISVNIPEGIFSELESAIEKKYGVREVVVADIGPDDQGALFKSLGGSAASWLENHIGEHEVVGISSWSETLYAVVKAMHGPVSTWNTSIIVQLIGGLGISASVSHATVLTESMARVTGSQGVFLMVPGVCESEGSRNVLMEDIMCRRVFEIFEKATMLLVGIGPLHTSRLLRELRSEMDSQDEEELKSLGAVGDICFRYFDENGRLVNSNFDKRVIGISPELIKKINNTVVVGGGMNKLEAIRAALRGGWINTLITDAAVASELLS